MGAASTSGNEQKGVMVMNEAIKGNDKVICSEDNSIKGKRAISLNDAVDSLLHQQLATWSMAGNNYAALSRVLTKQLTVNGIEYSVQYNPARITSSAAKVDAASIKERRCFLCQHHLPQEQKHISLKEWEDAGQCTASFYGNYTILVNPFPIFPRHLTIPEVAHTQQSISMRFGDMLLLAQLLTHYTIFYNGAKCGASAPDHLHFQAGNRGFLPIEKSWKDASIKVAQLGRATLLRLNDAPRASLIIESDSREDAMAMLDAVYRALQDEQETPDTADNEPMMNLLAWHEQGKWVVCVFPRAKHRPDCYAATGCDNILISPASVDLAGVFITPLEKDFYKIAASDVEQILSEVCLSPKQLDSISQRVARHL